MSLSLYECDNTYSILKYLTEADDDTPASGESDTVEAAREKLIERIKDGKAAIHISDLFDKDLKMDANFIENKLIPISVSALQERIMWAAWFLLKAGKVDTSKITASWMDKKLQKSTTAYLTGIQGVDPKRAEAIAYDIGTLIEKFGSNSNIIDTLLMIAKSRSNGFEILNAIVPLYTQLLYKSSDLRESDFYTGKPLARQSTYANAESIDDLLYQIKAYILLKKGNNAGRYDLKLLDLDWLKEAPISISEPDRVKATDEFLGKYKPGSIKVKLDTFTDASLFEDDTASNNFRSAADIRKMFDQAKEISQYEVAESSESSATSDNKVSSESDDPLADLLDAMIKNNLIDDTKAQEIKNYGIDDRNAFIDKFRNLLNN